MGVTKPPPDNLGSRHRALNTRVNSAASIHTHFDAIKDQPESSEVDKLYKIDLAAKFKNLEYVIEILKSGDSLYTSRVLKKCQWLYEDEYSHIMNPEYLQKNIFVFTSMKMKRKIVKAVAAQVRNPDRAVEYFHYCIKEKMKNTAFTCFLYTTEDFKLEQLRNNKEPLFKALEEKDIIYYRFLVGESFTLLDALLGFISINWKITKTARQFKNFFLQSEDKYLDIAEKYVSVYYGFQTDKFDLKLSDAIMKRHKHRVMSKPKFYVSTVNTDVLVRNSTIEDAKIYAKALLPLKGYEFWALYHYSIFRSVFQIIPHDKTYVFFKEYFAEHYPDTEFEMHPHFYKQEYYKFLTLVQQEEWAYRQLKSEKQILGVGRDYLWYKFIKFDVSFEEIKRNISVTKDAEKRCDMVQVLIGCAKTDRHLEALFKYYTKRHMNELQKHKESFLNKILSEHNVFLFDEECWASFYTLLLEMDQSNKADGKESEADKNNSINYKTIALLYHILHEKETPDILIKFLHEQFQVNYIKQYLKKITDENERQMIHEFIFSFYMEIIRSSKNTTFEFKDFNEDIEPKWKRYFENMQTSIAIFNEDGEEYEVTSKNKSKKVRYINEHEISGRSLLRDLKKDKDLVISKLPRAKGEFEAFTIKINTFLKKIKIYFPESVAKTYLDMFKTIILDDALVHGNVHRMTGHVRNAVRTGVNAIFQLADEEEKIDFMKEYCPVGTKIDRKSLSVQHIRIQRAICRYACLSRPPVPLSDMITYMKGDYMKYCLHIFNTYLALLPLPMCQHFVGLLIDSPVSIQKHAIRLAFQCFNPDSLQETILNIWKNTKNVSLRGVIFKAFFNKVIDTKEEQFYDVLKSLTLELNQDDEDAVFDMTVSKKVKLPEEFLGDYIEAIWTTLRTFKDVEPNVTRKKDAIFYMRDHIHLMSEEFVSTVVNEHVNAMMIEGKLPLTYSKEEIAPLYVEKWNLVVHHIIHNSSYDHSMKKFIELAQFIVRRNIENWDTMVNGVYVYQKCTADFKSNLRKVSLQEEYTDFEDTIPIYEGILELIETDLQFYDSYLLKWELKLITITGNVIKKNKEHYKKGKELEVVIKTTKEFGQLVGKLLADYVGKNEYFMSYSSKVKEMIKTCVEDLIKLIYAEINDEDRSWKWKDHYYSALITLADSLVEVEIPETYLVAIKLVPTNCGECSSEMFKCLINKFQEFPNPEVQLCLYQTLQKYCDRKKPYLTSSAPCKIY